VEPYTASEAAQSKLHLLQLAHCTVIFEQTIPTRIHSCNTPQSPFGELTLLLKLLHCSTGLNKHNAGFWIHFWATYDDHLRLIWKRVWTS